MEIQGSSASQSRNEFMQLLVTQLRHQDPLDPVKQEDFLAQLAQFSTLEGIEELNQNFSTQLAIQADALNMQQFSQAATMIGSNVAYANDDGTISSGQVDSVTVRDGVTQLRVDGHLIPLNEVTELLADGASPTVPGATEGGIEDPLTAGATRSVSVEKSISPESLESFSELSRAVDTSELFSSSKARSDLADLLDQLPSR